MKVTQIMTAHASCVSPDNTLVEAAGLMRELDVGSLPVCEGERLAGMVTDRDIVLRGVASGRDVNTTTVRDVMSPGVVSVFVDQEVEEVARLMEEKQIRRVPVLSRQQQIVGIISLGDVAVTSNPAFSGIALKEVSMSAQDRMRDQSPRTTMRSDGSSGRDGGQTQARSGRGGKATGRTRSAQRTRSGKSAATKKRGAQQRKAGRGKTGRTTRQSGGRARKTVRTAR